MSGIVTHRDSDLLRIATAGSVDDGKSTLIGRLLFDTKNILDDHLEEVERVSTQRGFDYVNLALLTDGLRAEREQGITIDVAYRYFATQRRRFIIADSPGHVQYTRNMVTAASTANVALILADAHRGLTEQSRRHLFIASLMRVPHVVLCVNKMDLVDYKEVAFDAIQSELLPLVTRLNLPSITFIPISALHGDNIVSHSEAMPWYQGESLLHYLETIYIGSDNNLVDVRFPVQWVNRPISVAHHDYRGYSGQVASGILRPGDPIQVLPSGFVTKIKSIDTFDGPVEEALPPMNVTITIQDDLDISRGDVFVSPDNQPVVDQDIEAQVCLFAAQPLKVNSRYQLKLATRTSRVIVKKILYKVDVNNQQQDEQVESLGLNDIGRIRLRATSPMVFDSYQENRTMGSFILIDEATSATVAAGMIQKVVTGIEPVLAGIEAFDPKV